MSLACCEVERSRATFLSCVRIGTVGRTTATRFPGDPCSLLCVTQSIPLSARSMTLHTMRCFPWNPMRWDSRHDGGMTGRGRGRWTGDAMPMQRTAIEAVLLIQVCAVLQGERTSLHSASQDGHIEIVQFLLSIAQIQQSRRWLEGPLCIWRCKTDMPKLCSSLLSMAQIRQSSIRMGGPLCIWRPPASAGGPQQSQPLSLPLQSPSCGKYNGRENGGVMVTMTGEGVRRASAERGNGHA